MPPVFSKRKKIPERYIDRNEDFVDAGYCFEASAWSKTFQTHCELTKIFRQEDELFSTILNEARVGRIQLILIYLLRCIES